MDIRVTTKLIALLGEPLGQSYAARIQNEAFAAEGLDYYYFPVEVGNDGLETVIAAARIMNFAGLVVTKPNKVIACDLVDSLDPLAKAMGTINTIVKTEDGKLVGYNTDGLACVKSLRIDGKVNISESAFFCIGAGGVGRAIGYTLAYSGAAKIYITDISPAAARGLCDAINSDYPGVAEIVDMNDLPAVYQAADGSDVVMNLTGLGMGQAIGQMPFSERLFHKGQLAFDAVYNPAVTRFLEVAEKAGCRILNGMNMNIYQGCIGFELHTGHKAPVEQMRETVRNILAGK